MADWLEQVSQWHEMCCPDLEVMSSITYAEHAWIHIVPQFKRHVSPSELKLLRYV